MESENEERPSRRSRAAYRIRKIRSSLEPNLRRLSWSDNSSRTSLSSASSTNTGATSVTDEDEYDIMEGVFVLKEDAVFRYNFSQGQRNLERDFVNHLSGALVNHSGYRCRLQLVGRRNNEFRPALLIVTSSATTKLALASHLRTGPAILARLIENRTDVHIILARNGASCNADDISSSISTAELQSHIKLTIQTTGTIRNITATEGHSGKTTKSVAGGKLLVDVQPVLTGTLHPLALFDQTLKYWQQAASTTIDTDSFSRQYGAISIYFDDMWDIDGAIKVHEIPMMYRSQSVSELTRDDFSTCDQHSASYHNVNEFNQDRDESVGRLPSYQSSTMKEHTVYDPGCETPATVDQQPASDTDSDGNDGHLETELLSQGESLDWITLQIKSKHTQQIYPLMEPNKIGGYVIDEVQKNGIEAPMDVVIALPDGEVTGTLYPNPVFYQFGPHLMNMMVVTVRSPLKRGCSGAWVTHKNQACGVVIAIDDDHPNVYILPFEDVIKDMEKVTGKSIRLPSQSDFAFTAPQEIQCSDSGGTPSEQKHHSDGQRLETQLSGDDMVAQPELLLGNGKDAELPRYPEVESNTSRVPISGFLSRLFSYEKFSILRADTDHDGNDLRYATLSHCWGGNEAPPQNLQYGDISSRMSFGKLKFRAGEVPCDGTAWLWVDACCIDNDDSAETLQAIESMLKWYTFTDHCNMFMDDIPTKDLYHDKGWQGKGKARFSNSTWFTRGWTLQELLALLQVACLYTEYKRTLIFTESTIAPTNNLKRQLHSLQFSRFIVCRSPDPDPAGLMHYSVFLIHNTAISYLFGDRPSLWCEILLSLGCRIGNVDLSKQLLSTKASTRSCGHKIVPKAALSCMQALPHRSRCRFKQKPYDMTVQAVKRARACLNSSVTSQQIIQLPFLCAFVLLNPLADRSLQSTMGSMPDPATTSVEGNWYHLYKQMYGIIEAVEHIHSTFPSSRVNSSPPQYTCYADGPSTRVRNANSKVGNFLFYNTGSRKFQVVLLDSASNVGWIIADHAQQLGWSNDKRNAQDDDFCNSHQRFHERDPDIWSLGCMLLEMICWFHSCSWLQCRKPDEIDRHGDLSSASSHYLKLRSDCQVNMKIEELRKHTSGIVEYQRILDIIERLTHSSSTDRSVMIDAKTTLQMLLIDALDEAETSPEHHHKYLVPKAECHQTKAVSLIHQLPSKSKSITGKHRSFRSFFKHFFSHANHGSRTRRSKNSLAEDS